MSARERERQRERQTVGQRQRSTYMTRLHTHTRARARTHARTHTLTHVGAGVRACVECARVCVSFLPLYIDTCMVWPARFVLCSSRSGSASERQPRRSFGVRQGRVQCRRQRSWQSSPLPWLAPPVLEYSVSLDSTYLEYPVALLYSSVRSLLGFSRVCSSCSPSTTFCCVC